MTDKSDEDVVGYGRPPKKTRWKKGQSGNPNKIKPKRQVGTVALIDGRLLASVTIAVNGVSTKLSALHAIMYQLLQKSLSGNKKAGRVLGEFEAFAAKNRTRQTRVVFVDNDYTEAFSIAQLEDGSA